MKMMLFTRSRRRRLSDRVKARLANLPVVDRGGSEELEALDACRRELRAMRPLRHMAFAKHAARNRPTSFERVRLEPGNFSRSNGRY